MVDTISRREQRLVIRISAVRHDDLELAGGKGANLGELVNAGFPVPDGFIVSTAAYASVVEEAGLGPMIADGLARATTAPRIRAAFENVDRPGRGCPRAILEAYAELGGGPVAVRSSATAEDLAGRRVRGAAGHLPQCGRRGRSSRRGTPLLGVAVDRAGHRLPPAPTIESGNLRMAVVVQRMVAAELAGVMFTANPMTGARDEVVIDASRGLGEAVVSGLVTPDHYVLDCRGAVRERTPGRREVVIRSADGGGVTHTSQAAPGLRSLPDTALTELATAGPRSRRALRAAAGHRVGVRRRPDLAGPGASDDRTAAASAQTEPPPAPGRPPADGLHDRPALPTGHERLGPAGHRTDGGADAGRDPRAPRRDRRSASGTGRRSRAVRASRPASHPGDASALARLPAGSAASTRPLDRDPRFRRFEDGMRELAALDLTGLGWTELLQACRRTLDDGGPDHRPARGLPAADRLGPAAPPGMADAARRAPSLGCSPPGARTRTGDANRALEELADPGAGRPRVRVTHSRGSTRRPC